MPRLSHRTSSIVLIGNSHNPTIISNDFFTRSHMIDSFEEVDVKNVLITPAVSQVRLKNGISITIDPERLNLIGSPDVGDKPFRMAENYCRSLPFIKCRAVGINFEYKLEEVQMSQILNQTFFFDFRGTQTKAVDLMFLESGYTCTVKMDLTGKVVFNYHKTYSNVIFENIDIDFVQKWGEFLKIALQFLAAFLAAFNIPLPLKNNSER